MHADMSQAESAGFPVPTCHLDTDAFPPAERFDGWRRGLPVYDFGPLPGCAPENFRARMDFWFLDDLILSRGRLSPVEWARTPWNIQRDGQDNITFVLSTDGSSSGRAGDTPFEQGCGQVAIFDVSRPWTSMLAGNDFIGLSVRRALLSTPEIDVGALHGCVLDGVRNRVLADHLIALVRSMPLVCAHEVPAICTVTTRLILQCVAFPSRPAGAAASRQALGIQQRVKGYIDRNLASPGLGPEKICSDLGLSRSTLYRGFGFARGVAAFILKRRLEAVHSLLRQSHEHRSIATIAYAFGFTSDAHLNKAFRRHFGYRLTEVRSHSARSTPPGAGGQGSAG